MIARTLFAATLVLCTQASVARELIYTPINPSFGGNPLNSGHLLGTAAAQKGSKDSSGNTENDAELFVRQLQGRLLSALANQVTDAIFGANPKDNGVVKFGNTTVEFERTLDSIRLRITDSLTGTTTEIVVPQLVTK